MTTAINVTAWQRSPADPDDYAGGLIEAPDGSWLLAEDIVRTAPLGESKGDVCGDYLPRCVVVMRNGIHHTFECSDMQGAKDLARWFAMLANAAMRAKNCGDGQDTKEDRQYSMEMVDRFFKKDAVRKHTIEVLDSDADVAVKLKWLADALRCSAI